MCAGIATFSFQWLEGEFLSYLDQWEESVKSRTDIENQDKDQLLLSRETRMGLRMTGIYICHVDYTRIYGIRMGHVCAVLYVYAWNLWYNVYL